MERGGAHRTEGRHLHIRRGREGRRIQGLGDRPDQGPVQDTGRQVPDLPHIRSAHRRHQEPHRGRAQARRQNPQAPPGHRPGEAAPQEPEAGVLRLRQHPEDSRRGPALCGQGVLRARREAGRGQGDVRLQACGVRGPPPEVRCSRRGRGQWPGDGKRPRAVQEVPRIVQGLRQQCVQLLQLLVPPRRVPDHPVRRALEERGLGPHRACAGEVRGDGLRKDGAHVLTRPRAGEWIHQGREGGVVPRLQGQARLRPHPELR